MSRYAFLLGSAKEGFYQKKVSQFQDSLVQNGGFNESNVAVFPNGISELMLEYVLNNCIEHKNISNILLYICTSSPVSDFDKSFWLGGEEIRKSVIENYASRLGNSFQLIYDSDREVISEEELGYVKC